jgi:mannosyltransferase
MTQASDELLQTEESGHFVRARTPFVQRLQQVEGWRLPDWLLCLAIGGIALGFNLYRLGDPSLWFDEILSVERARQSLPVLWHIIFSTQQNMALYYLLLHFWLSFTALLGLHSTEFVARFPSAIFAASGSMMVFLLGRRFMGIIGSMIAAGLYLLNMLQLIYAQETRSYSLQLLLICTSWYALFAALGLDSGAGSSGKEGQTPEATVHGRAAGQYRWWVCYVVAMTLAIYAHLFSILILFAQVLTIGILLAGQWRGKIRGQAWSSLPAAVVSLVSTGVLSIPMLLAARHGSKTGWLAIPHLHDIPRLFLTISDNSIFYMLMLAVCCALGIGVVALVHLRHSTPLREQGPPPLHGVKDSDARLAWLQGLWPVLFALLCWLVVPVIASYVISQGHTRIFSSRYLVTIVPPLFLLVGLGIAILRWRLIQVVLAAILLLVALHHVPQYYSSAQVEDWRTPALWLEQHYQAGDGMVCYNNAQGCEVAIEYYLRAYPSGAQFPADSPGAFPWVSYDTTNRLGDFAAAVNPTLLADYGAKHPRLFFIAGRFANNTEAALAQAAQHWLDTHYHLIVQSTKGAVTIRLYATNAGP